ncbi:P2X purinoceptor 7-like [Saccostrea cucullata]|uniref:P2X purinoceptor 7-like n=1 Tax=Saccostrea cuccullata TaxID=36930 RepID=UPI002ED00FC7
MTGNSASEAQIDRKQVMSECKGYQYEPEFNEEELLAASAESSDDLGVNEINERGDNTNWCTCGHCDILPSQRECVCCKEFEHYAENYISSLCPCISQHSDFDMVCLNRVVLETAYVAFLRYKRKSGQAPQVLTNRQSRLMAYRQFICFVRRGQPLGKKNRVVLPACVVIKIRKAFPDDEYEGFHSESSSSDSD